jgi:hypothetical protein
MVLSKEYYKQKARNSLKKEEEETNKLSEYLHSKMGSPYAITWRSRTVEQLEEWITAWRENNE